ncbi:MAG: acyltransferase [Porphyrobacter sp.]|nr:acyltransferase [Porphyrobacter sp.]
MPEGSPALTHRPAIDGLRAIAIAAVVINHAFPEALPGGFAGVDLFFVISGYLITAIIAADLAAGRFSLWAFWQRRIRRIVPALAAMLAATGLAAWAILTPADFYEFAKALAAAALFGSNLLFARDVDYFYAAEGAAPLIHTWTLGVEEQFYLAFPLLMLAVFRWRRASLLPVAAAITLASFALALWLAGRWPLGAFYLLPTRMWELGIGACCALLPPPRRVHGWLAAAGLALIAAGFALINHESAAPGAWFLLPTIGTALAIRHGQEGTLAAQVLGWRGLTGLGLVSFGTYLWHQPLLALGAYLWFGPLPVWVSLALIALSVLLGAASWRWIEQPVRRRAVLPGPRTLVLAAAAALALPAMAGAAGYARLLLPRSGEEARRLEALQPEGVHDHIVIPATGPLGFVLYGDSHAGQYFAAARAQLGTGALLSQSACLAADGVSNRAPGESGAAACTGLPDQLVDLVTQRKVRTLIWAQRWERDLYGTASGQMIGTTTGGKDAAVLIAAMERTIARLPQDVRVIVIGNSPTAWAAGPQLAQGWLRCRVRLNGSCPDSYPAHLAEGREISAALTRWAAVQPRVTYVDAAAPLCPAGRCLLMQEGRLNYYDGSHLTQRAAAQVLAGIDPGTIPR